MALTLSHYRFGVDELAENTHGWYAAEDTNPASGTIALDTNFLLRFTVQANTTGLSNVDNEFQFRVNGGTWTNITTTSSFVRAVAVTPLTNGGNCTKRLSGTGTFESSGAGQTEDGTSGGTANDIVASGNSETECGLVLRSADLTGGETIEFRLTRDGGTLLDTYSVVPTLLMPNAGVTAVTLDAATLTATSIVDVIGSTTATLGAVTSTTEVDVEVRGTTAVTLDAATLSATGTVGTAGIEGTLAVTLDTATSSATAAVDVAAALAATLGTLSAMTEGDVAVVGQVAQTLAAVTSSASAAVDIIAALASTLAALSATTDTDVEIRGSTGATFAALAATSDVDVEVRGSSALTLADLTLAGTGTVGNQPIEGTLSQTLASLSLSASAAVDIGGAVAQSLAPLALSATGGVEIRGLVTSALDLGLAASAVVSDVSSLPMYVAGAAAGSGTVLSQISHGKALSEAAEGHMV